LGNLLPEKAGIDATPAPGATPVAPAIRGG
jgi:hypothetical protein